MSGTELSDMIFGTCQENEQRDGKVILEFRSAVA
jgi:hypothetical protein